MALKSSERDRYVSGIYHGVLKANAVIYRWETQPRHWEGTGGCYKVLLGQVLCYCLVSKLCPTPLQPQGLEPARLLCPWDFPGKNTGVGCHALSGDLLTLSIKPASPALASIIFTSEPPGKA